MVAWPKETFEREGYYTDYNVLGTYVDPASKIFACRYDAPRENRYFFFLFERLTL